MPHVEEFPSPDQVLFCRQSDMWTSNALHVVSMICP